MQPRVIFRTHYQVDEPLYVTVLVKSCTSPVQSAYDESIAKKLSQEVRARNKEFNVAAAGYALDLGRALGVVSDQNVWTDKGHLLNLTARSPQADWSAALEIDPQECLLFFRLFLEADGAALRFLAKYLIANGAIPSGNHDWNDLAKELFLEVYGDYLKLTATTTDRVALRTEIDRIRSRGYTGKSGSHKLFVHLQALYRLGLLERTENGSARLFRVSDSTRARLSVFLQEIPGMLQLEELVRDRKWLDLAAKVFKPDAVQRSDVSIQDLFKMLVPKYDEVMATGIPLCPLSSVIEAVQIDLLALRSEVLPYAVALESLHLAQKQRPSDVRFHVDRRGAPAFLKLSDPLRLEFKSVADALP